MVTVFCVFQICTWQTINEKQKNSFPLKWCSVTVKSCEQLSPFSYILSLFKSLKPRLSSCGAVLDTPRRYSAAGALPVRPRLKGKSVETTREPPGLTNAPVPLCLPQREVSPHLRRSPDPGDGGADPWGLRRRPSPMPRTWDDGALRGKCHSQAMRADLRSWERWRKKCSPPKSLIFKLGTLRE